MAIYNDDDAEARIERYYAGYDAHKRGEPCPVERGAADGWKARADAFKTHAVMPSAQKAIITCQSARLIEDRSHDAHEISRQAVHGRNFRGHVAPVLRNPRPADVRPIPDPGRQADL